MTLHRHGHVCHSQYAGSPPCALASGFSDPLAWEAFGHKGMFGLWLVGADAVGHCMMGRIDATERQDMM